MGLIATKDTYESLAIFIVHYIESSQDWNFSNFRIFNTFFFFFKKGKKKLTELLNNAKNTLKNISQFLVEENLTQCLECTVEAPITQSLTYQEIINRLNLQES